jgi:ComF family protein
MVGDIAPKGLHPFAQGLRALGALGLRSSRCQICGCSRSYTKGAAGPSALLCAECLARLTPRRDGFCPACGLLFGNPKSPVALCGECRSTPRPWKRLYFFGAYDGMLRDVLLRYKFSGQLALGALLQGLAVEAHWVAPEEEFPDLLVPVPLHPLRLAWRGYNQSLELARNLASHLGRPLVPSALHRVRPTLPQVSLPRQERLTNLHGAFQAEAHLVEGKSILLVDDIMTTGATLEEATRTLRNAGASTVDALVLARAGS